ncbi:cholecystokinin receptor type A-like [Mizuhopecten yessoensis]|uniref:Orexin receptor type 2 n=1 Tax=Mizuhopecten yessoensis TaxID=6573 RepID=A0A210PQS2_MIZYE|nr:cholecystokinin receptor type A-like [Mizuhopecten yessoensis]OWF38831.1 Orexin receptor type 2 [Mizuhopecten yessoensis]
MAEEFTSVTTGIATTPVMSQYTEPSLNFSTLNVTLGGNDTALTFITSGPLLDLANNKYFDDVLLSSLVYVCILLAIGLPGNVLVLYVYGFKWNHTTSRIFIMALAAIDLTNCMSSMATELYLLTHFFKFDFPYVCKVTRFVTSFCNNSTTIVLSAIAVDRFKRICRPLEELIDIKTAKKIVLFAVVIALATSWPLFVLYGTHDLTLKKFKNVVLIGKTCEIEERWIKTFYPLLLVGFLFTCHFAGDILFLVLYIQVGKAIIRQRKNRKSLKCGNRYVAPEISAASCTMDELDGKPTEMRSRNFSFVVWNKIANNASRSKLTIAKASERPSGKPKTLRSEIVRRQLSKASGHSNASGALHAGKTTMMLFLVTVVFAISFLPYCVVVILRATHREEIVNLSNVGKSIYNLLLRSYFLNSVLNPVVYCFVSQLFRNQVIAACKCTRGKLQRTNLQMRSNQGSRSR